MQADWTIHLSDLGIGGNPGSLKLGAVVNYLDTFKIQNLPGSPFQEYAGTILNTQIDPLSDARPRWKSLVSATYATDDFDLGLRWRYIGPMNNAGNVGNTGTVPGVVAVSYFDLLTSVRVKGGLQLRAGVTNLLDRAAPQVSTIIGNTDYATYDLVGRRFFVGGRVTF